MKKLIYNFFFRKYQNRKLYMIGLSHILLMRKNYSKVNKLSDVDYKIFSQNGEDGILDYLLYQLKIEKPKYIEIGVGDYTESNTRFIFERCSPKGTVVDCLENLEEKIKKNFSLWKSELKIVNDFVNPNNIIKIMREADTLNNLDIFSLDIDGIDYWILKELPKDFSKIAIVEFNPIFGKNLKVSVPNIINFDRKKYHYSNLCFGMSLQAAIEIMNEKNFYFVGTNLLRNNAFFVSKNYKKEKYFKNLMINNIENSTDANFTESRDIKGNLNFLNYQKRVKEILECEVVDLSVNSNIKIKLKDLQM